MKYISTLKQLKALWDANSPEAREVVDKVVESIVDDERTYGALVIYLKGGRTINMRSWVEKGGDITTNALWVGLTTWLSDLEDNTPYTFSTSDSEYNTYIVKSEVVQIELVKVKDKK